MPVMEYTESLFGCQFLLMHVLVGTLCLAYYGTSSQRVIQKKCVEESWNMTIEPIENSIISKRSDSFSRNILKLPSSIKLFNPTPLNCSRQLVAMAATIDSFFLTVFRYPRSSYKNRNQAYYYNSSRSSSIDTYYYGINYNNIDKSMGRGRPLSLQTVELKVRMCCTGCERVVKNALSKLKGVDSVEVDLKLQKVTVTGYIDGNKVLKEVRRSGKKAEFWPNPDHPLYFTSAANYFHDEESFRDSYNYWRHGYNGDKHGHIPAHHRGEDPVSNMFNDDDVNACSIM